MATFGRGQWLFEHRKEGCSGSALAMAAGRGHLEVVKWFYEENIPGDISKAIDQADEEGHVEVNRVSNKCSINTR